MGVLSFNTNRDEITGLTHDNTFYDVDLSSKLTSGATGVIIEVVNTGAIKYNGQIRCNGSTDDLSDTIISLYYQVIIVKCDGDRKIEIKSENSGLKYYVVGELGTGAELKTNVVDKSTTTTAAWEDVDITTDLETGDAGDVEAAIVMFHCTSDTNKVCGIRKNGSTDSYELGSPGAGLITFIIGVDSNDILEQYISHATVDLYLIGYIKKDVGLTMNTNATVKSSLTSDVWTDLDITTDTSSDADGAILLLQNVSTTKKIYSRENGSANSETYNTVSSQIVNFVGLDNSQILEYYLEDSTSLYILGYTGTVAAGGTLTIPNPLHRPLAGPIRRLI